MSTKSTKGNKGNMKAAIGHVSPQMTLEEKKSLEQAADLRSTSSDLSWMTFGKRRHKRGWASM